VLCAACEAVLCGVRLGAIDQRALRRRRLAQGGAPAERAPQLRRPAQLRLEMREVSLPALRPRPALPALRPALRIAMTLEEALRDAEVRLEGPEARGGGGVLVRGDDERAVLAR